MSIDRTKSDNLSDQDQQTDRSFSTAQTTPRSTEDFSNKELKAELQSMDDYDFEHLVADLWKRQGWETEVLQQSNDRGVDVVAEKDGLVYQKWLIQAKRYKQGNNLGGPQIREYIGLKMRRNVDEVLVVSTADFTRSAYQEQDNNNINLINGDQLVNLINRLEAYDAIDQYIDLNDPKPSNSTITSKSTRASKNTELRSQQSRVVNSSRLTPSELSSSSSWSDTMPELTQGMGQVCAGGKLVMNHFDEVLSSHDDVSDSFNKASGTIKEQFRQVFKVLPKGAEMIIINNSETTDELATAGDRYIQFMQSPPRTRWQRVLGGTLLIWLIGLVGAPAAWAGFFLFLAWLLTPVAIWRDWKVASKHIPNWGLGKHRRRTKWGYILGSFVLLPFAPLVAGFYLFRRWQLGSKKPSTYGHARMFRELIS